MFSKLMAAFLAVLIILAVPQGPTASADPTSIVDELADTSNCTPRRQAGRSTDRTRPTSAATPTV